MHLYIYKWGILVLLGYKANKSINFYDMDTFERLLLKKPRKNIVSVVTVEPQYSAPDWEIKKNMLGPISKCSLY